MQNRRNAARMTPTRACFMRMTVSRPARVLDLSASGGLLALADCGPEPAAGDVRMTLAGVPFAAHVAVRRCQRSPGGAAGAPLLVGAEFTAMNPDSRRILDGLLKRVSR
jgi:hypothetical protein